MNQSAHTHSASTPHAAHATHDAHKTSSKPKLDQKPSFVTKLIFFALLVFGLGYSGYSIYSALDATQQSTTNWLVFILLAVALFIALAFEFVNGFHDTANAVATVIYTHSLAPNVAVIWSGFFNFLGVLTSSGLVAFGIISLLPVELILQVGSSAGFAMVFALLIAAILWNLGTWWLGLPASSSHTLIGSIIGVGVANALMNGRDGTSGVDWSQAANIGYALLLSPIVGFIAAGLLLLAMRALVKNKELYAEPQGNKPPPWWIRMLLILTCTGVSFAHGSNDGQKGMGLIMLILVGTVPTAYALNRAMPATEVAGYAALAQVTSKSLIKAAPNAAPADSKNTLSTYIRTHDFNADVLPALAKTINEIGDQVKLSGTFAGVPTDKVSNVRNDMYLTSETVRLLEKTKPQGYKLDSDATTNLKAYKQETDNATKFIPTWVKVVVAIALGLGTMVGWKRIVVTVGEKIGKTHLSYGQGASAEITAMLTIGAADIYGLPVSTTHVLSSGVAGTMAANGSGVQMKTIRNLLMAWVLTLPSAIMLSAFLYWAFSNMF
jgi:PiT family inorganic phosphate transporter